MNYQSLTELQARAIVHGDALKAWQRHAAEKAVTRLLQDAADTASEPATGAETIARHKSLCAPLGRSVTSDEATMLRRLLTLPALPNAVANRIVTGTATLADALVALDLREDLAAERGRLRSAVERFAAKATNLLVGGPAQVSARAGTIDTLFNGLSHADFALTQSSWSAFRSRVRRVAAIVDPDLGRTVKRSQLSGTWATLVAAIDQKAGAGKDRSRLTKQERIIANHLAKLWPLIAFCVRREVEPEAINDQTVQDFLATSDPDKISARFAVARNAIYAWAYLQSHVQDLPKQRLARIYSDGRSGGLHFDDLPQSLRDDWAAFVERNRAAPSADLSAYVADDAASLRQSVRRSAADDAESLRQSVRRPAAKINPTRLDNLKSAVTLAANAMIAAGGSPQGLRDLVDPGVAEQTVQAALLRQRRKNPAARPKHSYLKSLAGDLLKIGRLIGISANDEQMLVDLRDDYDPYLLMIRKNDKGEDKRIYDTERMGPRHADRLDQFNDPVKLHAWFQMMPLLYKRMEDIVRAGRKPTPIEVNDAIVCVLHAITQSCPVRRENLAKITIGGREPWLRLPAFEGDRARLTIPAQFVKNLKQIDAELTAEAAEIVRCFIEHFRPAMVKAVRASSDNRFLFPAAGKKARSGDQLNKIFFDRNWRVGGFRLNVHCQRHVCAKIILDEDPTRMALVQILLDHKSIVTTGRFYARINKIIALREFHQLVAKRRQALIDLMSEKKRHSAPRRKRSDKGGREDGRV